MDANDLGRYLNKQARKPRTVKPRADKPAPIARLRRAPYMGDTLYGNKEARLELDFPKGTGHRVISAALYRLAAAVEDATPREAGWGVQVERDNWRIVIELVNGGSEEFEVDEALATLNRAAKEIR